MKENLVWNVFCVDRSNNTIGTYNVFNHSSFYNSVIEVFNQRGMTKAKFSEEVKREAMYYYWSKFEWEIGISHPFDRKNIFVKTDIYEQLKINWDLFIGYTWSTLQKTKGVTHGEDCYVALLHNYEDTDLVTFKDLEQHIEDGKNLIESAYAPWFKDIKIYDMDDYCDLRKATDITRFKHCPICGKQINWKKKNCGQDEEN